MKVGFSQIYLSPEAQFPFSLEWQRFFSKEISARLEASPLFLERYGTDSRIVFNVSAKREIGSLEIKGPTYVQKYGMVEFTLFIAHPGGTMTRSVCRAAMVQLFGGIIQTLASMGIETNAIETSIPKLTSEVLANADMFDVSLTE